MPAINPIRWSCLIVLLGATTLTGCNGGRKLYPVKGRVSLATGDIKLLAGSFVEAALVTDSTVRASGVIQPDGAFSLETLENGSTRPGVPPGKFRLRIVLASEDAQKRSLAESVLPARYADFNTSGIAFDFPTSSDVTVACVSDNQ